MSHISVETLHFTNPHELYQYLARFADECSSKLTIMAGHHMVVYRRQSNRLVPLMLSLANEDDAEGTEREKALSVSDFPEASLEIGVRLVVDRGDRERKVALLVNDHQFQTFQADLPTGRELARLKSEYYRENGGLPHPLKSVLEHYGAGEDIFERNDARRAHSPLPSATYFFSENALRNNFEKRRKSELLKKPGFRKKGGGFAPQRVVYQPPDSASSVCLIDEHAGCGCNGAMTEFLIVLSERGAKSLIVFVPDECRDPVDQSIKATMEGLLQFDSLVAVWGNDISDGSPTVFQEVTVYRPVQLKPE